MCECTYLDAAVKPGAKDQANFMRVSLRKIETTPMERMHAQAMQAEIRLPDDDFDDAVPSRASVIDMASALASVNLAPQGPAMPLRRTGPMAVNG